MTILEKIKFEEDWLSEVNLTKENVKIAFAGIRATALEQQPCEDCVSKAEMEKIVGSEFVDLQDGTEEWRNYVNDTCLNILDKMNALPSVTPQTKDERKIYEQVGDAMFFLPDYAYSSITMTNDEIIKALKAVRTIHNGNYTPQIDGAIKIIEAQPMHGYKIDWFTPTAQAWLSSFNTESATCCFTAVQQLKKKMEDKK